MELDVRTILFFYSMVTAFVALLLLYYTIITKNKNWCLDVYLAGRIVLAAALIGSSFRGSISDFLSIGISNVLIYAAMALEMYSFISIDGKFRKKTAFGTLTVFFILSGIFLASIDSRDSIRIILMSIPGCVYASVIGLNLIFFKKSSKIANLIGLFYFMIAAAYVLRVNAMIQLKDFTFMESTHWVESLFFIMNALILVVGTIGFILILKERQEFLILQKNEALNQLNITKDKFFSIIAHDLRGPIGALNNIGKVLVDQHGDLTAEDRKDLINAVNESSGVALDLLNNLLYWAQSESGQLKTNTTKFRPTDLLSRAALIFREAANLKNIKITVPKRSDLVAYADIEMIDTVIRNLFSNAIKFTPDGGEVEAGYTEKDGYLEVFVKDTGVGMDAEVQSKLFRLDSDHSTKGTNMESGSGLGLKLCKEFVEKNDGEIWVNSNEQTGTTFTFTISTLPPGEGERPLTISHEKEKPAPSRLVLNKLSNIFL